MYIIPLLITFLGAAVLDTLEGLTLVLIGTVIAADLYFGRSRQSLLILAMVQAIGLGLGISWAISVGIRQDVAGPYAWAMVVGAWIVAAIVIHLCYLLHVRRAKPKR